MVSFYRPTKERIKILIEAGAFPSDQYAVASQARFHGFDPKEAVLEVEAARRRVDCSASRTPCAYRSRRGSARARPARERELSDGPGLRHRRRSRRPRIAKGCVFGFDLAHGAGNLRSSFTTADLDFAVWCSYKYLNAGPGAIAGCFVHERHWRKRELPRFAGWWGQNKRRAFRWARFDPIPGPRAGSSAIRRFFSWRRCARRWSSSIEATMPALRAKSEKLTGYLEFLLGRAAAEGFARRSRPRDPEAARSAAFAPDRRRDGARAARRARRRPGVICDFREPDIVRASRRSPLYNRFRTFIRFAEILRAHAQPEAR